MYEQDIRMVDLSRQYLKIKAEVDAAIQEVIDESAFIKGAAVKLFQAELAGFLGCNHVIPCGNGTDALQVAMMALDLSPGDEIITTPFTFIATIEVIKLLGLKPVLADVDPGTFNIDPVEIRKKIGPATKAIVPVHLFGQCADMDSIMDLAREHHLHVIEDTAQALGADYTYRSGDTGVRHKAGTMGTIGCTSFFPSKNLGAFGDGGAVFTNNAMLGEKLAAMVNHGMKRRYYYDYVGVNSRLDTLQAAILRVKLKHLHDYNLARQKAASFYDNAFGNTAGLVTPMRNPDSTHIFHQYTLKVENGKRDGLQKHLKNKNVPSMVYYPVGLHVQKAYEDLGYAEGDFPVTEDLCNKVLSLPMHTELDEEQLEYITSCVLDYLN
ncbi:MAG TPA: DegT/DnrJ/EryC1/StrS family aminotransferase [Bacteroidales bacterium]|nr:DegT/DnrJ/EryC1/StrS family aminotransferase [Bacteroidales bacterium]